MTHQEREQYFAQYWGQKVLNTILKEGDYELVNVEFYEWDYKDGDHLLLTALKNISDEDAINVAKIFYPIAYSEGFLKAGKEWVRQIFYKNGVNDEFNYSFLMEDMFRTYQYLQSKGYALPFRQYSVQDLINEGVLKLK